MAFLSNVLSILGLVIGFGFVIFWHELGHFLAAKWVGIKVEQFAVGMGHALVSFRRGIGWKLGNTRAEYDRRVIAHLDKQRGSSADVAEKVEYNEAQKERAGEELGLGETEYRLSWIPIGGYVKMLGQDDTKPNSDVEDPRAFNKKTIPQRMLVVSAGVVMNIILAGILFMVLFLYGFRAPAPVVGQVVAGSPAQRAGYRSGDTVLTFDGHVQHDFTKISLNTALASPDEPIQTVVRHLDGKEETIPLQPVKPEGASKAFLTIGISPSASLKGLKQRDWPAPSSSPDLEPPGMRTVTPGDVITKINGRDVRPSDIFTPGNPGDYHVLVDAAQNSNGKPVELTILRKEGKTETVSLPPHFQHPFMGQTFSIAGMQPRMRVDSVMSEKSPVFGKFKPDDVIQSIIVRNSNAPASQPGDLAADVSFPGFIKTVSEAGQQKQTIDFVVLRDGKPVAVNDIKATVNVGKDKNGNDRLGIGVASGFEEQTPVIAAKVKDSPAGRVKDELPAGSTILAVDDQPVKTWFDVRAALMARDGEHKLALL